MFGLGVQEIVVVLVIGLVVFGAARLPEIGAGLGKAIKNFKKATTEPEEIDITDKSSKKAEEPKEPKDQ